MTKGKKPKKTANERRKHPRTTRKTVNTGKRTSISEHSPLLSPRTEVTCAHCGIQMQENDKALFVEQEVGRTFCTEECISGYFAPQVKVLETEYNQLRFQDDLSSEAIESLAHLRWPTLENPDEIWREATAEGDHRYILISEFRREDTGAPVWLVCITLLLNNEPSFLFMAFPTQKEEMMKKYRRGDRVVFEKPTEKTDGLAEDGWGESETILAQQSRKRKASDIPTEQFPMYQSCVDETLQDPDEVWVLRMNDSDQTPLYHFIRHYSNEAEPFWFVILAREIEKESSSSNGKLELLDAFPSHDPELVESCKRGSKEMSRDASTDKSSNPRSGGGSAAPTGKPTGHTVH